MRLVRVHISIHFKDPHMGRIISFGYGVQHQNSRFGANCRFNLFLNRQFVRVQLGGLNFEFCHLDVLARWLLG